MALTSTTAGFLPAVRALAPLSSWQRRGRRRISQTQCTFPSRGRSPLLLTAPPARSAFRVNDTQVPGYVLSAFQTLKGASFRLENCRGEVQMKELEKLCHQPAIFRI